MQNYNIGNVNLNCSDYINPGIAGTEYMFWLVSSLLNRKYSNIEVVILGQDIKSLPKDVSTILVKDIFDAIKKAKEIKTDIFVFRAEYNPSIYSMIDEVKLKSIAWGHNYFTDKHYTLISKSVYVKRYICVGKEQYDTLRDHELIKKSSYIYNSIDVEKYSELANESRLNENIVCYIGSIVPNKGFHVLAKQWHKIEKKVPNAKLYVLGSGKLYNRNSVFGKYGIASEEYENQFIKYLLDDNGKVKENIKLFGVCGGKEKLEIMKKAKVGVVNPTGKSETFCIGAIEFEALGIPVVSRKKYGLLDTVKDNVTGSLIIKENELSNKIIKLLNDRSKNLEMGQKGKEFVKNNFDIDIIAQQWKEVLQEVDDNINVRVKLNNDNYMNHLKWLRELNRLLKKIPMFKNLPSIQFYLEILKNKK